MEREFRTEVKSLFDDMVGRQQGELSVRDQCEHAYEELTATVNGKYKELTGKDLPASMARNLDQLLTQITMAPLNEPEHGPGLWAKLPQHSIATMVEARPLDLTGSPTRMDIDLMMLHTIRMGRFLTTHYTDWAQTLPPCWIRHDDVVQEVYALKCYMDLVVASPNGGLYAPTLQSLIHSTLERVKAYLASSEASNSDHRHHLSGQEERQREQARKDEYEHWFNRDGGWSEEPGFDQSWRFSTPSEGLDTVCDLMTPPRRRRGRGRRRHTRNQAAQWRSESTISRYEGISGIGSFVFCSTRHRQAKRACPQMKAHGRTQSRQADAQARTPFRQNAFLSEDQLWTDESFRLTVLLGIH